MNFTKIAAAVLALGISALAADAASAVDNMNFKANVQTHVTRSVAEDTVIFSSGYIRANIGGTYKSENLEALIMLRIFAPEFGNDLSNGSKTSKYDKILADLYWANYKWHLTDGDLNLKIGRWKTDWSQSTHFGTYLDKSLSTRGLWMRDYSHNAIELGWKHGFNQLNAMVGVRDGRADAGYIRIEDNAKLPWIPLELKLAYRANILDQMNHTSYMTHRLAAFASYTFMPNLRLYGEYGLFYTQDDDLDNKVYDVNGKVKAKDAGLPRNYQAQELSYMNKDGEMYMPFYVGLELPVAIVPGINNALSNFYLEMEYIKDRGGLDPKKPDADDLAWTIAMVKNIGKSKLQFSIYSENLMSDVGLAFRLTTTIK
ncbi:MAG: hypothetical protein HUK19_03695 [Fibrobacter sp.]|nr:hypothetical protein [Fibrobacter sp.]